MLGNLEDERFDGVKSPFDEALIREHCLDIEEKIRTAPSAEKALIIIEDACRELENLCGNDFLPTMLRRQVEDFYQRFWEKG
ncbi:MAG: hypothetical protein KDI06_10665 [Calditrichaeota bacterium]|nr:hypothetical protein [Calditrichota bacterium]HQU74523.1 hypothetical protein [Calditrichia bacterium]